MANKIPERETQYVKTPDGYVGYQVFGSGPLDLLLLGNWSNNLDAMWQEPSLARYLDQLSSFSRVICFDKRGSGVSDPVPIAAIPSLDEWMDDARAVIDEVGSERLAVLGETEGGPMAIVFAATFPERVSQLVLVNTYARWQRADDYLAGMPPEPHEKLVNLFEATWGRSADILLLTAPTRTRDARLNAWLPMYQRLCMPPGTATAMFRWVTSLDVREVLPSVRAPTLIIHRKNNVHHRVAHGRYLADNIPGARYEELPGSDSYPFHVGAFSEVLDLVEEFLTGEQHHVPARDRMLATVLFTDIVESTRKAAETGDEQWLDLLQVHDRVSAEHVDRYRGEFVKSTGDGIVATFDGPARAVTCGLRLVDAVHRLGIDIRAGLHTGEIELRDGQVGGLAVHIAARVMAEAPDSQVAVSSTVRDLVVGSGFSFQELGTRELKGVPGTWTLHQVSEELPG